MLMHRNERARPGKEAAGQQSGHTKTRGHHKRPAPQKTRVPQASAVSWARHAVKREMHFTAVPHSRWRRHWCGQRCPTWTLSCEIGRRASGALPPTTSSSKYRLLGMSKKKHKHPLTHTMVSGRSPRPHRDAPPTKQQSRMFISKKDVVLFCEKLMWTMLVERIHK